jgi:hypothetical protein
MECKTEHTANRRTAAKPARRQICLILPTKLIDDLKIKAVRKQTSVSGLIEEAIKATSVGGAK